jgi:uncharacterized protein
MLGELGPDEIDEVLRSEILARIGCIADGWPYVVPVTYLYDGESIYIHSGEGRKLRAMRDNPQVCVEVEHIRSTTNWRTVIARGIFESLWQDTNDYGMKLLSARYASSRPGAPGQLDRNDEGHRRLGIERPIVYRIRLVERTGRFEQL